MAIDTHVSGTAGVPTGTDHNWFFIFAESRWIISADSDRCKLTSGYTLQYTSLLLDICALSGVSPDRWTVDFPTEYLAVWIFLS